MELIKMKELITNEKIRHSNDLNATLAALPLSAKRALFMALGYISPNDEVSESQVFTIDAKSYARNSGIDISLAYLQLKDGVDLLRASYFSLDSKDIVAMKDLLNIPREYEKASKVTFNLVSSVSYHKNDSCLKIRFSSEIMPLITKLRGDKNKYTTQLLISAMSLNNHYSSALYMMLRKLYSANKWKSEFEVDIDEIKNELVCYEIINDEIVYKYPLYSVFKREVLSKAIKDIEKKTEIKNIKISVGKKDGKKYSSLIFSFKVEGATEEQEQVVEELINFVALNKTANVNGKEIIDNRQANKMLLDLTGGKKRLSILEAKSFITEKYYVVKTEK